MTSSLLRVGTIERGCVPHPRDVFLPIWDEALAQFPGRAWGILRRLEGMAPEIPRMRTISLFAFVSACARNPEAPPSSGGEWLASRRVCCGGEPQFPR